MRRIVGMVVGLATLTGVAAVPSAFGVGKQFEKPTPRASSGGEGSCQPSMKSGNTGVTVVVPPTMMGPDDSIAQSCTYVSSNGGRGAQAWSSNTPNSFTIAVNDGHKTVTVEKHGDLANPGDQVMDRGSFTAPRGSVVTVSLLNGCPQPGVCGSLGTVSASAPDAPGSPGTTSGGGGGHGTVSVGSFGTLSGGAVQLTASCSGGAACAGKVEIDATATSLAQKHHKPNKHKRQPKLVVVARGSYSVPGGTTVTIRLAVTKQGKTLLKQHHGQMATMLEITPKGAKTTTRRLKLTQTKGSKKG